MSDHFTNPLTCALRQHALTFAETTEGASCVNRAFKVRKKNFLFLGEKPDGSCKVMLKLGPSLPAASRLAQADARFEVGKNGWTTVRFGESDPPDPALLTEWVGESYRLFAPKSLLQ